MTCACVCGVGGEGIDLLTSFHWPGYICVVWLWGHVDLCVCVCGVGGMDLLTWFHRPGYICIVWLWGHVDLRARGLGRQVGVAPLKVAVVIRRLLGSWYTVLCRRTLVGLVTN